MKIDKIALWVAQLDDRPGGALKALNVLSEVGVDLSFLVARRQADRIGKGIVFVSPIEGSKAEAAAQKAGFIRSIDVVAVRVAGENKPGLGAKLTKAVADAGLNLRAINGNVIDKKFTLVFAFDNDADANSGLEALKKIK